MKIFVVSKGRFADGNFRWVRRKEEACDFLSFYGSRGLDRAIEHAAMIRQEPRLRGNRDAHALQYFED